MSKAWKPALAVFGLMIIGGVAAFAVMYSLTPDHDDLVTQAENESNATQIMWDSEDGEEGEEDLALTTGEINRVSVTMDDIPDSVVSGVLAAEQHTFYEDPGVSISGSARALIYRGEEGGGSTITQQMARNYYSDLSDDQTITRKIREIFIALKLSQQLEDDAVLEQYLNTIYFGRNASGIEAAAQAYFDKSVSELDDAEGAFMGMIIQQPSAFANPEPDGAHYELMRGERWEYMQTQLSLLNEVEPDLGLSEAEAQDLEFPEPVEYDPEGSDDPKLGYVRNAVIDEVERRYGIDGSSIATQGYVINTSLDEELMDAASDAFDVLPDMADDTMRGLTTVRPETGEIVAFHGGSNPADVINNSLTHQTQAGSAYKPYVLAEALTQDIGLRSTFDGDSPQEFPGLQSEVRNADDTSYGEVDLIDSTADSVNTSFVDLAIQVGEENVDNMAVDLGVAPDRVETSTQGPLIALGTHQVNTLDMATGYATFAAEGRHYPPHMVTEVTNAEGEVIEPEDASELADGDEVISNDVAADATHAMEEVVENGGGESAALGDGHPVAGKTGTSSDAVSAWFVGYTPQLSTAVSLSRVDGDPLQFDGDVQGEIYGGTTSANVWNEFMTTAMEGEEPGRFPEPSWVGEDQSFLPSPSPTEEPEEEHTEEPSEEPSEPELCDPREPDCDQEPSEEHCELFPEWCEDETPEPPEDEECHWLDPECDDEDEDDGDDGDDGDGDVGTDDRQTNNSLVRPDRD